MAQIRFEVAHQYLFDEMLRGADEDIRRGVKAGADLLASYTQDYARRMWNGRYATGTTAASLRVKQKEATRAVLTYDGDNRRGTRNGEVAFLNEYGKRGVAARAANRLALDDHEDVIVQRMADEIFKDI